MNRQEAPGTAGRLATAQASLTRGNKRAAAGLALASVATFTDSLTKIADAIRRLAPPVQVTGDWRSEPLQEPGTESPSYQYHFKLKAHGTQLFGTVYYIDPAGGPLKGAGGAVLNGRIEDNKISFEYLGGWNAKEIFYGVVSGDEIEFTYQRDRSVALHFVAKRVLSEGRSPVRQSLRSMYTSTHLSAARSRFGFSTRSHG